MKKTLLILASVLFSAITFAQTVPQGINYQAVARDANGNELTNQSLSVRLSVVSGSSTGTISWQETHAVTTNDYGLFTAVIGQGTSTAAGSSATFDAVDWGSASHYIKVEIDAGSGFADMGTNELMSVPYALSSADNLWQDDGNGQIQNASPGRVTVIGNPATGVNGTAIYAHSSTGTGVYATATGTNKAVHGSCNGGGYGGYFTSSQGYGVYATAGGSNSYAVFGNNSTGGYGGYFMGKGYFSDYVGAPGGIHIGSSSDPGTDNLVVDGSMSCW